MHLLCLACYQSIVECALWILKMLSACTVRVQATSCLKHSMLACITESLDPQSAITLCCECQPVLDLQLANRAWPSLVGDRKHLHKGCQQPAVHTVFSPDAATLTGASAKCTDTMTSHAKNGSDGTIGEGRHIINEVTQAEAVALMGAQVCLHLTLTCVCTVDRATLLQQC